MTNSPLVSIVVTTRNESKNIQNCLSSIVTQTYDNIELIVVDNFSTDRTREISRLYTDLVYEHGPERSAQRNFGLFEISQGQYGMYVDADMILSPSLVENCVSFAVANGEASLYIPEVILGNSLFNRVRRYERKFYEGTCIDAIRFFHMSTFQLAGGFDEEIFCVGSGEDWDFNKKSKLIMEPFVLHAKEIAIWPDQKLYEFVISHLLDSAKNLYLEKVCIYHNESEIRLQTYLAKKSYYSKGFRGYIEKWGKNDEDIKKQFGLRYRMIAVFIERDKWKIMLKNIFFFFLVLLYRLILALALVLNSVKRK
jgi:glycosyltransferase involved in cell wall biosynthesis